MNLDKEQEKAVTLRTNGIVAAGAGSGKTKVLASRYVWLVNEENLKPEEILTLTFTNKAVSEMYSRIYQYLLESDTEKAHSSIKNFHKARIHTLDSFSAIIARTAAPRYGISPDFKSDETSLRDLAREAALRFVLDNREDPAIRQLLVDHKIRELAEEIFTQTVTKFSSVSSPLDPGSMLAAQKGTLLAVWREKTGELNNIIKNIIDSLHAARALNESIGLTERLGEILREDPPPAPDMKILLETGATETRRQIHKFFDYYSSFISPRIPSNYRDSLSQLVNNYRRLKGKEGNGLLGELESIANCCLNFDLCSGVFSLIEKFQHEFNGKKKETGFLSFRDIAQLAVDALKDHPDIRKAHKDSLRMIMIDEFQDNNSLQRDLVYLLAENSGRMAKGLPAPHEVENERLFFVGDEKQSIYRFRGADVSVFRSLDRGLEKAASINLIHNYRSRPALIAAFNRIFGGEGGDGVFLPPGPDVPDYEAVYSQILPPLNTDEKAEALPEEPLAHFCFLNEEELPEDKKEGIKSQDLEAAFIAEKIRDMVTNKTKILKRTDEGAEWQACEYKDFAVLERFQTHQNSLEKYFREFGIPFSTDRPAGLFNEAPIMDLRAYLRLIVYPEDRISYAALIRSPFTRLGDLSLAVCMLKKTAPFSEENDPLIPEEDLPLYRDARESYRALCEASRTLSITELITKLWFDEGYRYETLWTESAQVYESLFDLFFSMASEADSRGKSLAEFIDYIDELMKREAEPDDRDIPGDGDSGVRIMTIHKSKGLEFPVVFIFDCTHAGNFKTSASLLRIHPQHGLILKIPQAEELPSGGDPKGRNYFRDVLKAEEEAKDIAELRRILYVAMTRAESRLFLTFTLPLPTDSVGKKKGKVKPEDTGAFSPETIRDRLLLLDAGYDKKNTFLKLLAGVLPGCPASLCSIETIPVLTRADIKKRADAFGKNAPADIRGPGLSQREAALAAASFYRNAEILPEGKAGTASIDASKLSKKVSITILEEKVSVTDLDSLIEKNGIEPAEFGSLVHSVMEGRLTGRDCIIPAKLRSRFANEDKTIKTLTEKAELMADSFLASDLGKRWAVSPHRESEFPVITTVTIKGRAIAIMGKIDLLFEEDNEVVVADFKTDKTENPEDHYGQLASYYRAASDIFAKPVTVWLCFLRSGNVINVTEDVQKLPLEELAAALIAGN